MYAVVFLLLWQLFNLHSRQCTKMKLVIVKNVGIEPTQTLSIIRKEQFLKIKQKQ